MPLPLHHCHNAVLIGYYYQYKNRFEKQTTPGQDICKHIFKHGAPNQTATSFCFCCQISQGGLFLHGIETVVLSTIHVIFKNLIIFPASLKNRRKDPKLQDREKRLFI